MTSRSVAGEVDQRKRISARLRMKRRWADWRRWRITALALTLAASLMVFLAPFATPAWADGGAPNLGYVVGGGADSGDLVIIDIAGRSVTGRVAVGGDPHAALLSSDGRFAYVTQTAKNSLAVVDAQAKTVLATIPTGPAPAGLAVDLTVSATRLFIANSSADTVTVMDPDTRHVVATVTVGRHPTGVAVAGPASGVSDRNMPEVYVANSDDDTVSVFSATNMKPLATVPMAGGPTTAMIPQNGGVAYIGTRSGAIGVIRLADHKPLGTVFTLKGGGAVQMDYNAVTGSVYAPDPAENGVAVLRPVDAGSPGSTPTLPDEPLRILPVAGAPAAVAIPIDGTFALIGSRDSGAATMIDLSNRQTLATLAIGGHPRSVITGPNPPLLDRQTGTIVGFAVIGLVIVAFVVAGYFFLRSERRHDKAPATQKEAS